MKKSPKQVVLGTETGYKEGGGAEEERKRNQEKLSKITYEGSSLS